MGKAKSKEKKGQNVFLRGFGGNVFTVMSVNGIFPVDIGRKIIDERDLLLQLPPK